MADSINEELDYKESGNEELDWGYEEGKESFVCMWRNVGKMFLLVLVHSPCFGVNSPCFCNVSQWRLYHSRNICLLEDRFHCFDV